MDNLTHFIFGYILFSKKMSLWEIILFTNLPDIISAPARFYYTLLSGKKSIKEFLKWEPNNNFLKIYRFSHSVLVCLTFGFILSFFTDKYLYFTLGFLSHIFLDIFSHGGQWGTRIFYPISDFYLDFGNWFHEKLFFRILTVSSILTLIIILRLLLG